MTQMIIYPNDNGGVALLRPITECGIPLLEIARKDVPAGLPYKFVDESELPKDHTFFNAWEADFTNPDGYGIGNKAWFIEQYQTELATLDPQKDLARIEQLQQMIAVQQAEV